MMEKKRIYRVCIKVSYCVAYFDFELAEEACSFLKTCVESSNGSDEGRDVSFVMKVVDPEEESEEE